MRRFWETVGQAFVDANFRRSRILAGQPEDDQEKTPVGRWKLSTGSLPTGSKLRNSSGAHLAELRERILLASGRADYATPRDIARVLGETSALSFLRRQVGLYGELLENWRIVQAAREPRDDGMRLSENVACL